jgi:hypothetical protein
MQTILAALIGALVVGLIDVGVWALAYYGHINLHLPSQPSSLNFVSVDKYIAENLPPHYEYTIYDVSNFRGTGNNTLVVAANYTNYVKVFSGTNPHDNGILMLLDKNSVGNYQIDYKYEPTINVQLSDGRYVNSTIGVQAASLPYFSTSVLVAQWLPNSNGIPAIFGMFVVNSGSDTKSYSVFTGSLSQHLRGSVDYTYEPISTTNVFAPYQIEKFDEYQVLGLSKTGWIVTLNRIDDACDMCNHVYASKSYSFYPGGGFSNGGHVSREYSDPSVRLKLHLFNPFGIS